MTKRQSWRDAATRLQNVTRSPSAMEPLSQEEIDWVHILRDRFFELTNRSRSTDQTPSDEPDDFTRPHS